jgi:hypothetical protein
LSTHDARCKNVTALKALALSGFAVLFSAGAGIVAIGGHAAETSARSSSRPSPTTTEPGTTTTLEQTTTWRVIVPTTGTTTLESEAS